jgi:hypothetical protein
MTIKKNLIITTIEETKIKMMITETKAIITTEEGMTTKRKRNIFKINSKPIGGLIMIQMSMIEIRTNPSLSNDFILECKRSYD